MCYLGTMEPLHRPRCVCGHECHLESCRILDCGCPMYVEAYCFCGKPSIGECRRCATDTSTTRLCGPHFVSHEC